MFVRCKRRFKDGKEHRYWSVVENVRVRGGRVVQRHALYLGEINDSQRAAWCRSVEVLEGKSGSRQMALFPEDREAPELACEVVRIAVKDVELRDPRQWGACWLALVLWDRLDLDRFWGPRLPPSRQGTRWLDILKILACYRLIDPGSEWRLHRHWYEHSALRDLLGCDRAIADDTLYRCLDKLLAHKQAFFSYLRGRWAALFDARFDVLLYDLTSTYFESDPRFEDKRRFGYSRDKRPDCVQVVIALIVTPEGFPLAYEVMAGNTADQTTLAGFLEKIERQYGRSERVWIMDRGIPTEETLASMREGDAPVRYLVGTPKGRLTRLEKAFLELPWQEVRRSVEVKLLTEEGELYVLVRSEGRLLKERGMRRRRLKKLWRRLGELQRQSNSRDRLMLKLGAAKKEAGRAWSLVDIRRARDRRGARCERLLIPPATGPAASGPPTRGPLSVALQHDRRRPRHAVAPVHAAHRDRAGVQGAQARPRDPSRLPSARGADRGAHLRLIHRLLPARHPQEPRPAARLRPHPARHPGELRHHPDGRRPFADRRRPASRPAAPHPAEQRARATTAPARHDPADTARAADLRLTARPPTVLPFGAL